METFATNFNLSTLDLLIFGLNKMLNACICVFLNGLFAFASIITDICWRVQKFNSDSIVSGSNNLETFLTSAFLNSYLNPQRFTIMSLMQSS